MTRRRAGLAAGTSLLLLLPLGVTATTGSWNDREWVHGTVGTSSLRCGTDTGFEGTASGRFLSGELLGVDLDAIADLEQMTLAVADDRAVSIAPSDAIALAASPPTYANPFDLTLLSGLAGVDLTGLSVPLAGAALGAANQYTRASDLGAVTGASGLVNNSGAVLVDQNTPNANLPSAATVSLDDFLPTVSGIAGGDLRIGAVGASSIMDGCGALRSALWDDGSFTGATRDYGIAGLGLRLESPAAAGLVGTVTSGVTTVNSAVTSLLGSSGLIAGVIGSRIDLALPGVLTTGIGGDVSLSGLDLGGAVSTLLSTPLTDGVVTVDLQSGAVDVDLDAVLPSLNDAAPNTQIVVNAAVLSPIIARVGTLLDTWTTQITGALAEELRETTITIDLAAVVAAPGISVPPLLNLPGLNVLDVGIDYVGPLGAVLDGTAAFALDVDVAGLVGPINTLLGALGLPTVTALTAIVNGLGTTLVSSVDNTVTTTALGAITTFGTTVTGVTTPLVSAVGSVVGVLPDVLSIMVNVQPDRPGAPPGSTYVAGTATSTPEYAVSALRIGLADYLTPGDVARVTLGTATAGPVTAP